MAGLIFVIGATAGEAFIAAISAVMVALITTFGAIGVAVIGTNRNAKKKGEEAVEAVAGIEKAFELLEAELERAHERLDLVEDRERLCLEREQGLLETTGMQAHEVLRLRSMVVALGGDPDVLSL